MATLKNRKAGPVASTDWLPKTTHLRTFLALLFLLIASCSQKVQREQPTATAAPTRPQPTATTLSTSIAQINATAHATTIAAEQTSIPFQPPVLGYLAAALDESLQTFDGLASYHVTDLHSGQSIARNADLAISGMSIVKIPILIEAYRALDEPPNAAQTKLITETATLSGNYTANLLLELIAGRPDPFAGAQQVTESVRRLGLYNTFIAVPYDLEPTPRYLATYATPANQQTELSTNPDSSMQTTVSDMGQLLALLFQCATGQGYLLKAYSGALTHAECLAIIDVMAHNDIDAFIEEGVPPGIPVAHKHGWVGETHGDAGIVQLEEHPYVFVVALHRPGWLLWEESTAIIKAMSALVYAHFADPLAYSAETLRRQPPAIPTIAPTPGLPMAVVNNTGGAGLTLRESPGGAEIVILPEGSLVFLSNEPPAQQGGLEWRKVQLLGNLSGWAVADFLQAQ